MEPPARNSRPTNENEVCRKSVKVRHASHNLNHNPNLNHKANFNVTETTYHIAQVMVTPHPDAEVRNLKDECQDSGGRRTQNPGSL